MRLIIDIPKERYKDIQRIASVQADRNHFQTAEQIIANGTPLEQIRAEIAENGNSDINTQTVLRIIDKYTEQEPEKIVKYGWKIIPKCTTCKYLYSPIVPCNRCKNNYCLKSNCVILLIIERGRCL